jgi:hypothetical protein
MPAFAIMSTVLGSHSQALGNAVKNTYPNDMYTLSDAGWLIADKDVTTQEVCKKLGVGEGGIDYAVVVRVDAYWGRASKAVWEWLDVKGAKP